MPTSVISCSTGRRKPFVITRRVRIGDLSLGQNFEGLLRWGDVDNRPFLGCMHGHGPMLVASGSVREAERVFDRVLWLNPSDNQGARGLIGPFRETQLGR